MKKILLLHGANLNKLGQRNTDHYGELSLQDIEAQVALEAEKCNFQILAYQSNHEGLLIDKLQAESPQCCGIILNPGAFTHYSYALHDALIDTQLPAIEVHLSNIQNREAWRKHSVIAPACMDVIYGKKIAGYLEAVHKLVEYIHAN